MQMWRKFSRRKSLSFLAFAVSSNLFHPVELLSFLFYSFIDPLFSQITAVSSNVFSFKKSSFLKPFYSHYYSLFKLGSFPKKQSPQTYFLPKLQFH
jgi:hypothetical protein